jgi:hypothetical protein
MPEPRPKKARQQAKAAQPPLPGMPPPEPPGTVRILPMQLEVGDRFSDESGEWEKPGVTETRQWGSYEKVTVIRRASTRGGHEVMRLAQRVTSNTGPYVPTARIHQEW